MLEHPLSILLIEHPDDRLYSLRSKEAQEAWYVERPDVNPVFRLTSGYSSWFVVDLEQGAIVFNPAEGVERVCPDYESRMRFLESRRVRCLVSNIVPAIV